MNKIFLCSLLFLFAITGCDSMFDDELPPHDLVGENAITNETSAETALNGIFSNLQGYGTISHGIINRDLPGNIRDGRPARFQID